VRINVVPPEPSQPRQRGQNAPPPAGSPNIDRDGRDGRDIRDGYGASVSSSRASETASLPADDASPAHRIVLDDVAIQRALMRIGHEIVEHYDDLSDVYLVAIPNGGVPLGRLLIENIEKIAGVRAPLGILDTTLYRDDMVVTGRRPPLRVTEMPSSVDDKLIVLVEDVVNTGRTIRAAMDALMDFGRPRIVQVVALVDRGRRELPIRIDYVGKNIPTQPGEVVRLQGSEGDGGDVLQGPLRVVVESESGGG
jgi:pyrimidine operon attenuation protein/uracil phosphoribosyltransferase